MAPQTIPFPHSASLDARSLDDAAVHVLLNAEDGTLHLLRSGFAIAGVAATCLALALWVFGGISVDGPRTAAGWLSLMVALMCMPFGLLLLLLGGAKWLRNHWLSRAEEPAHPSAPR